MSRAPHIDYELLAERLFGRLRRAGPSAASQLCAQLGVSQATLSRLLQRLQRSEPALLALGRGRARRYAMRRAIPGLPDRIAVFEAAADDTTSARCLVTLHPLEPAPWVFVESHLEPLADATFPELPWFLSDLRPAGFLGRLVPRLLPDADFPPDILRWSADDVLRYLARHASNPPGNLLVGDEAFQGYLEQAASPQDLVAAEERARRYPRLAADLLAHGAPGSSAAGEQPKFLVTREDAGGGRVPVLVKFSPPLDHAVGRRIADVLVAEHLALETLVAHAVPAATSSVVFAGDQVFLEVERFDREGTRYRRGVVSLAALDDEFSGVAGSWTRCVEVLCAQRVLAVEVLETVRWLEHFGRLIGNTDMHRGNLAFELRGLQPGRLAPVYDMNPALYMPVQGHLLERELTFAPPPASQAAAWMGAREAALAFWSQVATHAQVSPAFRAIARNNAERLATLDGLARLLPR